METPHRVRVTRHRHFLAPSIFALIILLMWAMAARWMNPIVLPGPGAVAQRVVEELRSGQIWPYAAVTAQAALGGSAVGAVVGIPLGYLLATSRLVRHTLSPWIAASQAIPAIALAPLLVMWVGYGMTPTVLLCALMVFFPMVITTHLGIRDIDPDIIAAARLDGTGRLQLLRYIQAPVAAPAILTGLRAGLTLSITGAVVGEFIMGGKGLGMLLTVYRDSTDTVGVFAVLIWLCTMAAVLYGGVTLLEHRMRDQQ